MDEELNNEGDVIGGEGVPVASEELSVIDQAVEQLRDAMDAPEFQPALIGALTEAKSLPQGIAALLSMLVAGPIAQMGLSDEDIYGPEGVLVQLAADIMDLASEAGIPEAEDPATMQDAITEALSIIDQGDPGEEPMEPMPETGMMPGDPQPPRKNGFAGA
jgi:hypothetical protein